MDRIKKPIHGVSYDNNRKVFQANIVLKNYLQVLGYFPTKEEAEEALSKALSDYLLG